MVREWDPRTAPSAEVESVLATLNAAISADLPDDPLWRLDSFRESLAVTMPGERRISWIIESGPGAAGHGEDPMGVANVLFQGDIGVLEVVTHPDARRKGLGRELVTVATRRAFAEGYASLGVEVVGDTPAVPFYEALGFRCAFVEIRHLLSLSTVDWQRLDQMAHGVGAGYRLEYYPGGPPEELYEAYADTKAVVRGDYPTNELELRPSSYNADRLRDSLSTLHARGLKPYVVVGIHEQSGTVAGLTEVVVPAHRPTRADQYDTVIMPAHRGYGLGRALKARMLFELRSAEPQLLEVQTWNAYENEPLLRVNTELGFRADRQWCEYEVEVADLARRLDPR